MSDVSVYVHFPFCKRKCRYCDFVSFENRYGQTREYCKRLKSELLQYDLSGYRIRSIFFGGGTPSSIPAEEVCCVLDAIRNKAKLCDGAEITIECNPSSLDEAKLRAYKDAGFTRISIGVQSFDDDVLNVLGRLHDSAEAEEKVRLAVNMGFDSVSLDLMFAVPHQTQESLVLSVKKAISLGVNHISLYSLIVEDGTKLKDMIESGVYERTDDDTDRKMYCTAVKLLEENGYRQYEISNFSRKGFESVHNKAYWERKEYIGLGCAAHSFFKGVRYSHSPSFEEYMSDRNVDELVSSGERVTKADAAEETVMLGLRMSEGFSKTQFSESAGFDIEERAGDVISRYCSAGLAERKGDNIRLTKAGTDFLDKITLDIIAKF